ncbi:MAG: MFS transporter [Tannerellaceae bacterium]|jgi:fucose permease|nr:MFS transporter [Tannerellaceae bacterium]
MARTFAFKRIAPVLFGFFVMGFVDVVGIATSYVKHDFALSDTLAGLLPASVFLWFALFSIPSGILMCRAGRRNTVALSLFVTAAAMLIPLFLYRFLSVLFAFALLGIGNTVLQVSLNPMAASAVHPARTAGVLALGQFVKAISSFLGPVIAGTAAAFLGNWKLIFPVYAAVSLLSVLWLLLAVPVREEREEAGATFASAFSLCRDRMMRRLFAGILCIVGMDVGLNTFIPKLLMDKTGIPLSEAGLGASLYFAARTAGSLAGAVLVAGYAAGRFLKWSMAAAIVAFVLLLIADTPLLLYAMIIVVGLMCANVFPLIFSVALRRQPERTGEISALMIAGVSGGALVTPFMGAVSDAYGPVAGFSVLLICLIYLLALSFGLSSTDGTIHHADQSGTKWNRSDPCGGSDRHKMEPE